MKLPGIDYTMGVQPLAKINVGIIGAAAEAKSRSAGAMAFGLSSVASGVAGAIQTNRDNAVKADAVSEYQDLWSKAQIKLGQMKTDITSSQYTEGEGGELTSKHSILADSFNSNFDAIGDEITSKSGNPLAKQKLVSSLLEEKARMSNDIAVTSDKWMKSDSHRKLTSSIENSLASGDYANAEKSLLYGASFGVFSDEEIEKIPNIIEGKKQYDSIKKAIVLSSEVVDFRATREFLNTDMLPNVTETQIKGLESQLNQKVEDSLITALRAVTENKGLLAGDAFIRSANIAKLEELGTTSENDKYSAVTRMQQVMEDYRYQIKVDKEAEGESTRKNELLYGSPADPKSSIDKKMTDVIFSEATKGEQPFSDKWNKQAKWSAVTHGWVPFNAETKIRAYLLDDNPTNVIKASNSLMQIEEVSPRALDNFSKDDIAFAIAINDYSKMGVPPLTTIAKIREGIYRVPNAIREGRKETFDRDIKKESEKMLSDLVSGDSQANPFFKSSATFPEDLKAEFSSVFKDEYIRTGDRNVAAKMAYKTVRNIWGVTDREGGLKVERNNPEALLSNGAPTPWLTEQFNTDMNSVNIDPSSVELVYDMSKPENKRWIILDKETRDVKIKSDGTILMWKPDYTSSKENIDKIKESKKQYEQAELTRKRQTAIEKAGDVSIYRDSVVGISDEERAAFKKKVSRATNDAAIRTWQFLLKDVPDFFKGDEDKKDSKENANNK